MNFLVKLQVIDLQLYEEFLSYTAGFQAFYQKIWYTWLLYKRYSGQECVMARHI